jgi:hypothetical protein
MPSRVDFNQIRAAVRTPTIERHLSKSTTKAQVSITIHLIFGEHLCSPDRHRPPKAAWMPRGLRSQRSAHQACIHRHHIAG